MLVPEKEAMESIGWGGLTCYISRFLTPPQVGQLEAALRKHVPGNINQALERLRANENLSLLDFSSAISVDSNARRPGIPI